MVSNRLDGQTLQAYKTFCNNEAIWNEKLFSILHLENVICLLDWKSIADYNVFY
jgi:hypothetical protein